MFLVIMYLCNQTLNKDFLHIRFKICGHVSWANSETLITSGYSVPVSPIILLVLIKTMFIVYLEQLLKVKGFNLAVIFSYTVEHISVCIVIKAPLGLQGVLYIRLM